MSHCGGCECDPFGDSFECQPNCADPCEGCRTQTAEELAEAHWFAYSTELDGDLRGWYDRANENFNIYTMLRRRYERLDKVLELCVRESPILQAMKKPLCNICSDIRCTGHPWPIKRVDPAELCEMYPEPRAVDLGNGPVLQGMDWGATTGFTAKLFSNRATRRAEAAKARKKAR